MPTLTAATVDVGANGQWRAAQGTITADNPAWNSTATWNSGATTFTHLKANVTDTASAAASLLADLLVGGASKWKVSKAGVTTQASDHIIPATAKLRVDGDSSGDTYIYEASPNSLQLVVGGGTRITAESTLVTLSAVDLRLSSGYTIQWGSASDRIIGNAGTSFVFDVGGVTRGTLNTTGWLVATTTLTAAAPTVSAGQLGLGATTQTTVGAAGAASALPANPTGYLIINVAGTNRVVPFYAAS